MRQNKAESIKYFTLEEIKKLFSAIKDKRDKALFLLAYRHGLRASEVALLQLSDIDFKTGRIKIHRLKGSLSGEHPLQPDEQRALKAYLKTRKADGQALFPSNRGTPIARRTLDYLIKQYAGIAQLPADKSHFHALKHSIATHWLSAGGELRKLQDWLGHANIQNTVIYAQLTGAGRDENARNLFSRLLTY